MVDTSPAEIRRSDRNLRVVAICVATALGMAGLSFAAVPLYDAFTRATGQSAMALSPDNTKGVIARKMGARFDATVSRDLPITLITPAEVSGRIGEQQSAAFVATNPTDRVLHVRASFNAIPDLAGAYIKATRCFCAAIQTLQPGQTVKLPVSFFVDPDLDKDKNLSTVKEMTLSYTFYAADNGGR
jgi:cytochrome c oxidase assembly protein subunit 11